MRKKYQAPGAIWWYVPIVTTKDPGWYVTCLKYQLVFGQCYVLLDSGLGETEWECRSTATHRK